MIERLQSLCPPTSCQGFCVVNDHWAWVTMWRNNAALFTVIIWCALLFQLFDAHCGEAEWGCASGHVMITLGGMPLWTIIHSLWPNSRKLRHCEKQPPSPVVLLLNSWLFLGGKSQECQECRPRVSNPSRVSQSMKVIPAAQPKQAGTYFGHQWYRKMLPVEDHFSDASK